MGHENSKIGSQEGFRCVTIECDSKINYRCLEKYRCDMKEFATEFEECSLSWVKREANMAVHELCLGP